MVPQEDEAPPELPVQQPGSPAEAPAQAPLFERDDFGLEFDEPVASMPPSHAVHQPRPAPAAAPPAPWSAAPGTAFDVVQYNPPPEFADGASGGIVLSPAKATLLTVLAILGMAVAFGAGLIVGRFMLG